MALLGSKAVTLQGILRCSGAVLGQPSMTRHSSHFTFVPESPDPSLGKKYHLCSKCQFPYKV